MPDGEVRRDALDPRIAHAQEVYTEKVLRIYDLMVLRIFCPFIWGCSPRRMGALYKRHVGRHHLELGPGTGYFLDRSRFPVADPRITLVDLSPECLRMTARRIARYRPDTVEANLMEPLPLPPRSFDSAAMNLVMHTIPGGWEHKGIIFKHVADCLRPGGVLFGTTVLARGVPMNRLTRHLMLEQHRRGNFQNAPDDPDGLAAALAKYFPSSTVEMRGCVAVFRATAGDAPSASTD